MVLGIFFNKFLPGIFSIMIFLAPLMSQQQIRVLDQEDHHPIPNVIISSNVVPGDQPLSTNQNGVARATFQDGDRLLLSHLSYRDTIVTYRSGRDNTFHLRRSAATISEIVVEDFDRSESLLQRDGPTSHIPESMLDRLPERMAAYRLNTRAGIRMEERATASYRISIRGSSLRAPFGIRNVKVYWNAMPLTRANGVTPMQMIDPALLGRVDILKGPMGSRFGAGNGGVLFFHLPSRDRRGFQLSSSVGSYGLQRHSLEYIDSLDHLKIRLFHGRQQWEGYREHSSMRRNNTLADVQFSPSKRHKLSFSVLHSSLFYQLPGGLTRSQMEANPRAAREGAAAQNSSIDRASTYFTFQHQFQWNDHWQSNAVLYLRTHDFDHPFILDYKQELGYGLGGRWGLRGTENLGTHQFNFSAGLEMQSGITRASNYENDGGRRGSLRFLDRLGVATGFLYQEVGWKPHSDWEVTLGSSQNLTSFDIDRSNAMGNVQAASGRRQYPVYFLPRIALQYFPNSSSSLFANWSRGASMPSLSEVRTNEGSINDALLPERGDNFEIGGRVNTDRVRVNFSTYFFQLSETITNYTNPEGVVLFRNAGETRQWGAELEWKWQILPWTHPYFRDLHIQQALSYQAFQFLDYVRDGRDLSGNALPGVAPLTSFAQFHAEMRIGIYSALSYQWIDRMPLNDRNSAYQAPIHFLTWRLGYQGKLGRTLKWQAFVGVDNILDRSFSFGPDLNAFGDRYFQPAPGRNFYWGVKVHYFFNE